MWNFVFAMLMVSLWPLIAQCLIVTLFLISMIIHVPNIYRHYSWAKWWPALGAVLVIQVLSTIQVMKEPFSGFPGGSLAPTTNTAIALLAAGWSLFAWVLATELTSRRERLRQEQLMANGEDLENYLNPFSKAA